MVFGFIRDVAKGVGQVVGAITGPIVGVSVDIVAKTLGITVDMVKEAKKAGCTTYEEIKEFFDLDK